MSLYHYQIEGAPQFVSYFKPVLRALQQMGGEATPKEVYAHVADEGGLSLDDKGYLNKNGMPVYENRIGWARFYMTKVGWMYSPKRGVWALTELGKKSEELTDEEALALYKKAVSQFKGQEEELNAPDDKVQPDDTQYWFVGSVWSGEEQLPRFITEGIWQSGYEVKFSDKVKAIKPGDKIAIKASFLRRRELPFDNKGLPVSTMRIKAIGTVTRNHGDARTVDVAWEPVEKVSPEWYFYTYRTTINRARVEDEKLAQMLVAFTFDDGQPQDYDYFMRHPYWRDRFFHEGNETLSHVSEGADLVETEQELLPPSYDVEDIITEGCFLSKKELEDILRRWIEKKNLILQGPPGTGKSWLAKKLAKALIGQKHIPLEQLRVVQFHPSLSYEDFIRGYRPGKDGRLTLRDGPFMQIVQAAIALPDVEHVLIIEEVNRGNPAQVFGEMLTLLENSKRSRAEALELAYSEDSDERVYVPDNLYVLGTMNIADRSLAMMDLALRRRFAFINLTPNLNDAWRNWCIEKGLSASNITTIKNKIDRLNQEIAEDRNLGMQFQVGHSYVTPHAEVDNHQTWFSDVVESEIAPLLHEYWYDNPARAEEAIKALLNSVG